VVIENKDIGFVSAGQAAEVKVETFSFTRYGTVPATVQWVTADAVNDDKRGAIFPATLRLVRNTIEVNGKAVKLTPGMVVTAEVKTGTRRVIEYLISPVQRVMDESVGER
jgi:hemolysin D